MTDVVIAPYPELLCVQFCINAYNFMLLSPSEQFLLFSQLSNCTIGTYVCGRFFCVLENFCRKFANIVALPTDGSTNRLMRCKVHSVLLTDGGMSVQIDP